VISRSYWRFCRFWGAGTLQPGGQGRSTPSRANCGVAPVACSSRSVAPRTGGRSDVGQIGGGPHPSRGHSHSSAGRDSRGSGFGVRGADRPAASLAAIRPQQQGFELLWALDDLGCRLGALGSAGPWCGFSSVLAPLIAADDGLAAANRRALSLVMREASQRPPRLPGQAEQAPALLSAGQGGPIHALEHVQPPVRPAWMSIRISRAMRER